MRIAILTLLLLGVFRIIPVLAGTDLAKTLIEFGTEIEFKSMEHIVPMVDSSTRVPDITTLGHVRSSQISMRQKSVGNYHPPEPVRTAPHLTYVVFKVRRMCTGS